MALNFKNFKEKLGKLSKKVIRAKDSDGHEVEVEVIEDADRTADDIPMAETKKKPVLKPIQILIVLLLIVFILTDDEVLDSKTDKIINNQPVAEVPTPSPEEVPEVSMEEPPAPVEEPATTEEVPEVSMEEPPAPVEEPATTEEVPEVSMEEPPAPVEEPATTTEEVPEVSMEEPPASAEEPAPTPEKVPEVSMEEPPASAEEPAPTAEEVPEVSIEEPPVSAGEPSATVEEAPEVSMEEPAQVPEPTVPETSEPPIENTDDLSLEMDKIDKPQDTSSEQIGQSGSTIDELNIADEVLSDDNADKLLEEIQLKLKQDKLLDEQKTKLSKNHQAPDYTRFGRALVYNCVDKHWSCVDAIAYRQCQANNEWMTSQNLNLQCVTENVYASTGDCERAQQKAMVTKKGETICKR